MGQNESKYGDPKAYFDDGKRYRSNRYGSDRRDREYYGERHRDINKKSSHGRSKSEYRNDLPNRGFDEYTGDDDSSYMRQFQRRSGRRYHRKANSDTIDELSDVRDGDGHTRRSTHQVIPMEREIIKEGPSYSQEAAPRERVRYVSTQPPLTEIREIEAPVQQIIEPQTMREQVVYVQSERPTQTGRIYERNAMPYATTQYLSSDPARQVVSSNMVYSQEQPRTSYVREIVPAQNTENYRQIVPRDRTSVYSYQDRPVAQRRSVNEGMPKAVMYNVADGHYVESFDVVDSGNKKSFHKGYSGYLSKNNVLGSRRDEGDVATLFRSRRD